MVSAGEKAFSPATRIRRLADFQFIRQHGDTAVGRRTVVRLVDSPDGNRRVAFVISRRYSPKAVIRNRARRLFREVYRRMLPELRDCWLEFRPRYRMQGARLADIEPEIRRLVGQLGGFSGQPGRSSL